MHEASVGWVSLEAQAPPLGSLPDSIGAAMSVEYVDKPLSKELFRLMEGLDTGEGG